VKIRNVYYLNEPSDIESDVINIRVLTTPDSGEKGGFEYSLEVTTIKFITEWMTQNKKDYYCSAGQPLLVVKRLDDKTILKAIDDILPRIGDFAHLVE
jgi:hypothetical protein